MTLDEIVQDIHVMESELLTFERKYGLLSETFYASFEQGEEPADDSWVLDWAEWAGLYKILLHRRDKYRAAIQKLTATADGFSIATLISRTARHESVAIPA